MDLLQVLRKSITSDHAELQAAQTFLEQAAQVNLPALLEQLSDVLKNGTNEPVIRMQAGLQLKNAVYSKDAGVRKQYQDRWLALPSDKRLVIQANVLEALGTESIRPSTAAQCVAYIACAELTENGWPGLVDRLQSNVTNPNSTEMMKESTLETIGYICQDIDPDVLQSQSNAILTAIVHGMKRDEPSNHVKLAATVALLNSLEFTKANFDNQNERDIIMQVVCESTQSTDVRIRVSALQCLVRIMTLYYQHMEHYMKCALFSITVDAMKCDIDDVVLQGIEFWSSVCDEEVDLAIEQTEAIESGKPPERTSRFYAKGALTNIVPIITEVMTHQEDGDDDDEWNPCKAAGVCLMLMATCCEDDIVPPVLKFVQQNIQDASWKRKDAAVMAFGSILEGPDVEKLRPAVEQAIMLIMMLLRDSAPAVRDTAAWTMGRVCELLPEVVLKDTVVVHLVGELSKGLEDVPRVANNVCWAFSSLAEAAFDQAVQNQGDEGEEPEKFLLSPYFAVIVHRLLATTVRPDGNQHNLRTSAYEALMEMIKNSPKDCYQVVKAATEEVLKRLQGMLDMEAQVSGSDRTQFNDLQSMLCATLQSVLKKMTKEDAQLISQPVMAACLSMLEKNKMNVGGVQEDAMQAVGSLIEALGEGFMVFMEYFFPYLVEGLRNTMEVSVCTVAINTVGDLCRAMGDQMVHFGDQIMQTLLHILGDSKVDRSVKPMVLSSIGDMALAMGPNFQKYLPIVLDTLHEASQASNSALDRTDYDAIDYLNELREGCLEAYTGIVQGLKGDGNDNTSLLQHMVPRAPHLVSFIEKIAMDQDKSDGVISATCGLIGDLVMAFGPQLQPLATNESINSMLTAGRRSKTSKTKTLATWATKELRKLSRNSS